MNRSSSARTNLPGGNPPEKRVTRLPVIGLPVMSSGRVSMGEQVSMPRSALSRVVADNLQRLRSERQLSEAELARIADVSALQVRRIEQQQTVLRLDTLERLARALAITPGDLFTSPATHSDELHRPEDIRGSMATPQRRAGIY